MTPSKVTREICLFLKTVEDGTFYASTCEAIELALTQAISEEREACAKVAENWFNKQGTLDTTIIRYSIGDAIRKRGEVGDE